MRSKLRSVRPIASFHSTVSTWKNHSGTVSNIGAVLYPEKFTSAIRVGAMFRQSAQPPATSRKRSAATPAA